MKALELLKSQAKSLEALIPSLKNEELAFAKNLLNIMLQDIKNLSK